jgi:hypothetical protein
MLLIASSQPALPDHTGDGFSSYIVNLSFICLGLWLWGKDEVRRHRAIVNCRRKNKHHFSWPGLWATTVFPCTRLQILTSLSFPQLLFILMHNHQLFASSLYPSCLTLSFGNFFSWPVFDLFTSYTGLQTPLLSASSIWVPKESIHIWRKGFLY